MRHATISIAAMSFLAAVAAYAVPMASQQWTLNRLVESEDSIYANVQSNISEVADTVDALATNVYTKTETEGLVSEAVKDLAAKTDIPTNNVQLANGAGYVTASITNGLVTASITNGLVTASITNGLVTASITNGLVTASITNGLVTASITNGLIGADAISTNNPDFVAAVTNSPVAVLNSEGKVPLAMLPPIEAGLKTNNVQDIIGEHISTNNLEFVAAVTNCPVAIASPDEEALTEWGVYSGGGTVGILLAALAAAVALLRRKKADSEALADEFSDSKSYAKDEYVTHDGKLYRFNAAHTAGVWIGTDVDEMQVTTPDATVDIGSDNRLRVVDADANILWSQGYQLADESSVTLSCDKVNLISIADGTTTLSLTMPVVPQGVVGDFIVDIDNSQNTSDVAAEITDLTNMKISVVITDGDDLNDLLTFAAGTMYELYFTQTAFAVDEKPTWKLMGQVVVSGNPASGN